VTKTTSITEALAELKTIQKRIDSKVDFINRNVSRREELRDPLDKQGGSSKIIAEERQAVGDLYEQQIAIRRAIAAVNAVEQVAVDGQTRTIADWLVWKREVAPAEQRQLRNLAVMIDRARQEASRTGKQVVGVAVAQSGEAKPGDIIVNINEQELQQQIERLETVFGTLDGLLSLKNATLQVTY